MPRGVAANLAHVCMTVTVTIYVQHSSNLFLPICGNYVKHKYMLLFVMTLYSVELFCGQENCYVDDTAYFIDFYSDRVWLN